MADWSREAEAVLAERFGKDSVLALATVEAGIPHVRSVNALYDGGAFYVLSSVGIALAGSIGPLLFWRGLQAVSSGAISSMSLAVVKDILRGSAMEKVVTWIQTVTILAPMLAPVAGGGLLCPAGDPLRTNC